MESIILNLLNLTGEERAAFAVLGPPAGSTPDGDGLTVEDWQSAQVILATRRRSACGGAPPCAGSTPAVPGWTPIPPPASCPRRRR